MDSRWVCMRNGQLFYHCSQKFLTSLNVATGRSAWRNLWTVVEEPPWAWRYGNRLLGH
jgi:hypothetical protein